MNCLNKATNILGVDILEEYKLVSQKKSDLSRSKRELIVSEFHKQYKIIK